MKAIKPFININESALQVRVMFNHLWCHRGTEEPLQQIGDCVDLRSKYGENWH